MITVYVHLNGQTRQVNRVEPAWLDPASPATLWVDLASPTADESRAILAETFRFHPLAVEDATSEIHHPKVEAYEGFLYLILHGIAFEEREHRFSTRDVDFFVGRNYLVTVHGGQSRSVGQLRDLCSRHDHILMEDPVALLHRIVDSMVDNYRPEIDRLEKQIDRMEHEAALGGRQTLVRHILELERDLSSLRRVVVPQRDAVGRLARREFEIVSNEMAYRFRDIYDHLVRLSEEAALFQDRVTGILDAHLSAVSNRLNQIVKVLTVMSTIFLPLTVLTSLYGMNVVLPHLPGGDDAQFWWIVGMMVALAVVMLAFFRTKDWI